jgi:hypothetical protein
MIKPLADRFLALIAASLVAAGITGLCAGMGVAAYVVVVTPVGLNDIVGLMASAVFFGILAMLLGAATAFPFYLIGLFVIGTPTWAILHRLRWINEPIFICVAAFESVIGGLVAAPLIAPEAWVLAPLLALPGAVAGRVLWRSGYDPLRPPLPSPAPPS